MELKLKG